MDGSVAFSYQFLCKKLKPQLRRCRDQSVRVKAEFILYASRIGNVDLAAKRLGLGRSSYYKWKRRLIAAKFNLSGLKEQSRRPKKSPAQVTVRVEMRTIVLRRKGYGAMMIQALLEREGYGRFALSTIGHIINKRRPPVKKKRRAKLKKHRKRYELLIPGQRIQLDVKYVPCLVGGKKAYAYVAIDECTRWRFAKAYEELNHHWTVDFLKSLKKAAPFPIHCIQTDNGFEFTFNLIPGNTAEHPMDTWCKEQKIRHRLIPPGLKELNGKVERSHRVDADYFYGRAPTTSLGLFNKSFSAWITYYNNVRLHGGIGFITPAEKLAERRIFLAANSVGDDLESYRQMFLRDDPKDDSIDRQLEDLELLLRNYNANYAS